jgi:hypothetical protein
MKRILKELWRNPLKYIQATVILAVIWRVQKWVNRGK